MAAGALHCPPYDVPDNAAQAETLGTFAAAAAAGAQCSGDTADCAHRLSSASSLCSLGSPPESRIATIWALTSPAVSLAVNLACSYYTFWHT